MKKVLILENLRSLHNVGSIFRTADSAGFQKIYLTGYTGCPPDRRIEKVSLGAENFIEWEHNPSPVECIKKLKEEGFQILSLEQTSQSVDLFSFTPQNENIALILGNEVEGVEPESLIQSEYALEIPMYGQKGSLNVSVACGIACYTLTEKMKKIDI